MFDKQIIKNIADELKVQEDQVNITLKLLSEGNTIPFIARYRKEMTNNLNEEHIKKINDVYEYQLNLSKRKETIINILEKKELLTDELKLAIINAKKLVELEDIYQPYKEKKKTKATIAISKGLKPLADWMLSLPKSNLLLIDEAKKYLNNEVKTIDEAINGAKDIIAEIVSDDTEVRKQIRELMFNYGILTTKLKPNAIDEKETYKIYYDYSKKIKYVPNYAIMAISRAENEKVISFSIQFDYEKFKNWVIGKYTKFYKNSCFEAIENAINDGFKRLLLPSIENDVWNNKLDEAKLASIHKFSHNLEKILLQAPIKDKIILGIDPAFRTGCKLCAINSINELLMIDVIYPHNSSQEKVLLAKNKILDIINKYNVNIIAIGNGTASRETEKFISEIIKNNKLDNVKYTIVSESGASVYSASKLAIEEFPNLQVEQRSAISIARRVSDPLSELIKIPPLSIGVGQYQHDLPKKELDNRLDFVVEKVSNLVGVDVNLASEHLLSKISGITPTIAKEIINYKLKNKKINSREELVKIKGFTSKRFEQAIGFLRIVDGKRKLDSTNIHPESYELAIKIMNYFNFNENQIGSLEMQTKFSSINIETLAKSLNENIINVKEIVEILKKPSKDYRDNYQAPILRDDLVSIENLSIGIKVQGVVRNIVDFGAFIDIGIKNDGLLHISKLSKNKVDSVYDVLDVGDIIDVYIADIDINKNKVQLSLLKELIYTQKTI